MNDLTSSVAHVPALVSASNTEPALKPRKSAATAGLKKRATSEPIPTVRKPRKPPALKAAKMVALASLPVPEPLIAVQDTPRERTSLKALSIGLSLIVGLLVLATAYGNRPDAHASREPSFHGQVLDGLKRSPY